LILFDEYNKDARSGLRIGKQKKYCYNDVIERFSCAIKLLMWEVSVELSSVMKPEANTRNAK
jgi:hypothetical protein